MEFSETSMATKILYNTMVKKALEQGIDIVFSVVSITLGPTGKNVLLEHSSGSYEIVNDGAKIIKEILLENKFHNIVITLIKNAALKTKELTGDGTATTIVLACAMIKESLKSHYGLVNPIFIKKGIEKSLYFLKDRIHDYAVPVESLQDLKSVATISAGNNDEVGSVVAKALSMIGSEGSIILETSKLPGIQLDFVEGIKFNMGWISSSFLDISSDLEIVKNHPVIVVMDHNIQSFHEELLPILEKVCCTGRPLLLVVNSIGQEALKTIIINNKEEFLDIVVVKIPGFLDQRKAFLDDFTFLTGAQVISYETGISVQSFSLSMIGSVDRVTISKNSTFILINNSERRFILKENLKKQMEKSINSSQRELIKERISNLSGLVALIRISETAQSSFKSQFEYSINVTKLALEEGILPGGGTTFLHLSNFLLVWSNNNLSTEEQVGALFLVEALLAPTISMFKNTGITNIYSVLNQLKQRDFEFGYNLLSRQIVNMYSQGIVDPTKVVRFSLQNAISVASILLRTDCIIC